MNGFIYGSKLLLVILLEDQPERL